MKDLKELKQKQADLIKATEELGKEIERLESEPKKEIWEPEKLKNYYIPRNVFAKEFFHPYECLPDIDILKSFAKFQTKEECQNFCNIIEAIAELKAWQKVYGSGYYYICYDKYGNNITYIYAYCKSTSIGLPSKKACEEIIPQLTDNCKAYLRGEFS